MSRPSELDGLRAVVTGGAAGIGLATVRALAASNVRVAALDIGPEPQGEPIEVVPCDVRDDSSVRAALAAVTDRFGGVDIVVNNAGIGAVGTVEDNDDTEWLQVLDVNLLGIVRTTRAALPLLRRSTNAAVVNTCSIAASAGLPRRALYSATKGAVQSLTLAMAADHLDDGIRVNCVNPGTVDTPWVQRLLDQSADPAAERGALESRQPTGQLVHPDEVARAICYLASPLSASTTGTVLAVDGGMHGLRIPTRT